MQGAGQEESKDERHKRLTRQSVLAADTGCRPLRRSHAPCSSAMEIDSGFRRPVTSRGAAAPPPSPFRYKWAAPGDAQPPSPPTSFLISTAQTRRAAQTPFSTLHHPISQPQKARCWGLHGRLCRRKTPTALAKTEGRRPHRHRYRPSYLPVPTTVGGGGSSSGLPAAESGSSRPSVAAIASVATASALPPLCPQPASTLKAPCVQPPASAASPSPPRWSPAGGRQRRKPAWPCSRSPARPTTRYTTAATPTHRHHRRRRRWRSSEIGPSSCPPQPPPPSRPLPQTTTAALEGP